MTIVVIAAIYCLGNSLRAFPQYQDPFALPFGGLHLAMVWSKGSSLEHWFLWLQRGA